jgi:hypothetical protein
MRIVPTKFLISYLSVWEVKLALKGKTG